MIIKILAKDKNIIKISSYGENISIEYATNEKIRLKSPSKDDDDILATLLGWLKA